MKEKDRTCFNCKHFRLCYLRRMVDDAMRLAPINIDGDAAPCKYLDIFSTLAKLCLEYKFKEET